MKTQTIVSTKKLLQRIQPLHKLSLLVLFGILGTLLRLLLVKFYNYASKSFDFLDVNSTLSNYMYANILGSFMMGVVRGVGKETVGDEFFPALTTGLCGCLTTFGGWAQKMSVLLAKKFIYSALWDFLIGFSLPVCAFLIGLHLGETIKPTAASLIKRSSHCCHTKKKHPKPLPAAAPTIVVTGAVELAAATAPPAPSNNAENNTAHEHQEDELKAHARAHSEEAARQALMVIRHIASILLLSPVLLAIVLIFVFVSNLEVKVYAMSLLFTIPGVLIRYYTSLLNPVVQEKTGTPLMTFIVNLVGTIILAIEFVIVYRFHLYEKLNLPDGEEASSNYGFTMNSFSSCMLNALSLGFCGSLTTVSTLVAEITSTIPRLGNRYLYCLVSFVPSIAIGTSIIALGLYIR